MPQTGSWRRMLSQLRLRDSCLDFMTNVSCFQGPLLTKI
ncbi:rCG41966 [Rattus norvegicus]|uniref:RCG41966 n=1 Tax=Rattus norvegicus TaxID=10116 RepID=A6JUZ9_RAT|nr:rCG41966 [Rattus norvegicus]